MNKLNYLFVFLAGCLLTTAFAPFGWSFMAILSMATLFCIVDKYNGLKHRFIVGYIFGIGFFSTSVSWVYVSINLFTSTIAIAGIATILFVLLLGVFVALFCASTVLFKANNIQKILIYPSLWVIFEIIRSYIFTGFPWMLLGYSQAGNTLGSFAAVGSVYLVSYFLCLISIIAVVAFSKPLQKSKILLLICTISIIFIGGEFLKTIKWTKAVGPMKTVSLVQADFTQSAKWNQNNLIAIMNFYEHELNNHPADLVFWSENSIPTFKDYAAPYLNNIGAIAKKSNSSVLVGSLIYKKNCNKSKSHCDGEYYNASSVYGDGSGVYLKSHLVPFAEYFPFPWIEKIFIKGIGWTHFNAGAEIQPLLKMSNIKVANFICYEIAFATQVRAQLQNANLIVVTSDDAWFGHSFAAAQHLQISQMRAIETSRYVAQATNSGITAIIAPDGHIIKSIAPYKKGVLLGNIQPLTGNTLWVEVGIIPLIVFLLSSLVFALCLKNCKKD